MNRCNYCTLQDFKRVADRAGGTVVTRPAPHESFKDGVDVFIHYPGDEQPTKCAWFMKLTDHCVC